jgi:hypothetical protein
MMKWMVRRISRHASRLVFYCHPHEFVHANRQSFPRNMSKWNMQGMTPENFSVLDRFVEHMLLEDYSPTLFANSLSQACASCGETNANTPSPRDAIENVHACATDLAGRHP